MPRRAFCCADASRGCAATSAGFPREERDQPAAVGDDRRLVLYRDLQGTVQLWRARYSSAAASRGRASYGEPYSVMVRTTLEVGRASPPPGPFTSLRICSS